MTEPIGTPNASDPAPADPGSLAAGEHACPTCGAELARNEVADHLAGVDAQRPGCARQDIGAIAERERIERVTPPIDRRTLW